MSTENISHREIYDRLLHVEAKVDRVEKNTEDVVRAFAAAHGAFLVLEWLGKIAKPILFIGATCTAAAIAWQSFKDSFRG
jgi:hypothetical protein